MTLDVEIPDPPTLGEISDPEEYEAIEADDEEGGDIDQDVRREELNVLLREGAWEEAFEEWAAHTYLTEAEFEVAVELGLIDEFDFYWDPTTDDVDYRAPTLPEDLPNFVIDALEDGDIEAIDEELAALARTVSERLEEYVDRSGEEFGFFADRD